MNSSNCCKMRGHCENQRTKSADSSGAEVTCRTREGRGSDMQSVWTEQSRKRVINLT